MPTNEPPAGKLLHPLVAPAALALLSLLGTLASVCRAPASGPVAMVFPPWWGAARAVMAASAAGAVIRLGAVPFVVIVAPADAPAARRKAGALLLLDPGLVPGCTAIQDATPDKDPQ